jgi:hypothetical protein
MTDLGVVYLYRHSEGEVPLRSFLEGLRRFPAGAPYQLHVVLKGFPNYQSLERALALFDDVPVNPIEVDDFGYDIGSYLKAARLVSNRRLIFLNTFSIVLGANWLAHFNNAMDGPHVGIVGATGSWQARATGYEVQARWMLNRLRRFSAGLLVGDPSAASPAPRRRRKSIREVGRLALAPASYIYALLHYQRHPNPHIRTNAFMIERDLFLSLQFPPFTNKESLYRFESGRRSMTNQIIAMGLKPVVVGKNGNVYDIADWHVSSTFWKNQQENLLISDNRTRDYAEGTPAFRTTLENMAWHHPRSWPNV